MEFTKGTKVRYRREWCSAAEFAMNQVHVCMEDSSAPAAGGKERVLIASVLPGMKLATSEIVTVDMIERVDA